MFRIEVARTLDPGWETHSMLTIHKDEAQKFLRVHDHADAEVTLVVWEGNRGNHVEYRDKLGIYKVLSGQV